MTRGRWWHGSSLDGAQGPVNAQRVTDLTTMLMLASSQGNEPLVKLLLAHGAALDVQNDAGFTALMFAAVEGRLAVVRRLLRAAALTDLHNEDCNTALQLAKAKRHTAVAQLLREKMIERSEELDEQLDELCEAFSAQLDHDDA